MPVGLPEFAANPENRVPVILLFDTSGSMSGQPIQELNRGIAALKQDILRDTQASLSVEVAIVGFEPVHLIQDFVTIDNFTPPILEAQGTTPIGKLNIVGAKRYRYIISNPKQSICQYTGRL